MKAPRFLYRRPECVEEALEYLSTHEGDAQVLAGGQSLIPTLNMRLSSPGMLVDINRISELRGISTHPQNVVRLGALARHFEVIQSDLVARHIPLFSQAMNFVAHIAVRNRGTTCGSLALADPSAEAPAVAVLLNATIHLRSANGQRDVNARSFFRDLYTTDRADNEMITGVSFPHCMDDELFDFNEIGRRHGDFAIVGIGAKAKRSEGAVKQTEIVIFGSEPTPLLSTEISDVTFDKETPRKKLAEMAHSIAEKMDPIDNHQGRADTKRKLAAELMVRAFDKLRNDAHG